jgi:hypothetical protein
MGTMALYEKGRLSDLIIFVVNLYAQLDSAFPGFPYIFLLTTIHSHVRCSIDIPPISHTCLLLVTGYTCFQRRSIGYSSMREAPASARVLQASFILFRFLLQPCGIRKNGVKFDSQ